MIEEYFENTIEDILNDCNECGGTTLSFHVSMCSNPDHRILAKLLLQWPSRIEEFEREDYEDQISELESDIHMLECENRELVNELAEYKEKLRVWTELCSSEDQKQK